jgi:two-component system LytT family response regulator
MLKAILIDDEINALDALALELNAYCPEISVVAKCQSGNEGLAAIGAWHPDVVFLDIDMPWMSGFEMLEQLPEIDFDVIFVTAYDQYAVNAFAYSAVDYLMKPVSRDTLIRAVDKVMSHQQHQLPDPQFDILLKNLNSGRMQMPIIALPTTEGLEFVLVADILYAESESNYCHVHLADGKRIFLAKTLKYIEEILAGHPFLRIHQSYLVNLTHVRKYVKGRGGYVVMNNGDHLAVSRSSRDKLMKLVRM